MSVVLVHKGRLFCFYTSRSSAQLAKQQSWFEWRAARGIVSGRDPTRSVGRDEVGTCSDEANSNQLCCFLCLYVLKRCLELLQETKVILEIIAEVAHLPLEHGNTLDSHTECKTAVLPAVNA